MRIFVDTNVILEFVLQREHYAEAKKVISESVTSGDELLISVGGFYTMIFLVEKYFCKEMQINRQEACNLTRNVMRKVLSVFIIAEHNAESLLKGIDDLSFTDIEDSCQYQLAHKCGCEQMLTFNVSDYPTTAYTDVKVVAL